MKLTSLEFPPGEAWETMTDEERHAYVARQIGCPVGELAAFAPVVDEDLEHLKNLEPGRASIDGDTVDWVPSRVPSCLQLKIVFGDSKIRTRYWIVPAGKINFWYLVN